jgi:hypothetical protein
MINPIRLVREGVRELEKVLSQLSLNSDIIEFQTFVYASKQVPKFTPLFSNSHIIHTFAVLRLVKKPPELISEGL